MERGFTFDVVAVDKGYDAEAIYELVESRHARPVIPLTKTPGVKAGKHKPPARRLVVTKITRGFAARNAEPS